ncbi:AbrB/MazE/SpoVT family DNA-binding domain-containing protein [Oribacterium sinus]|uniref:AbrB/MazE/SpoVT family DNA-binding domain-containing protein n=1 Tax=Oribacterium sinus TaxID=237576 RepID=UPI0028E80D8E|nr:AbrB/MazE/SpoVT family DNA-binding domain-containing protein [Oribacterium sinus]
MKNVFMDTAKLMSRGQVTIPKRIRDLLNLENGDYVTFVVNKDRVEIHNSNVLSKKTLRNKGGEMTI